MCMKNAFITYEPWRGSESNPQKHPWDTLQSTFVYYKNTACGDNKFSIQLIWGDGVVFYLISLIWSSRCYLLNMKKTTSKVSSVSMSADRNKYYQHETQFLYPARLLPQICWSVNCPARLNLVQAKCKYFACWLYSGRRANVFEILSMDQIAFESSKHFSQAGWKLK